MAVINIYDGADEYRIEIGGNFADHTVHDVDRTWRKALSENLQRKITVDISRLSNYDRAGCKLLRKMHQHGTVIAAATPRSLIFLQEITTSPSRSPVMLQQAASASKRPANPPNTKTFAAGS